MKVLMQNRTDSFKFPGGDTVQMLKTKEALEKLGLEVDVSLDLAPNLTGFDLVHVFNLVRIHETYSHVMNAQQHGVPVALSTIYWNFNELNRRGRSGIQKAVYSLLPGNFIDDVKDLFYPRTVKKNNGLEFGSMLVRHRQKQIRVLNYSSVWLPNAESELEQVKNDFDTMPKASIIVPNAIDETIFKFLPSQTRRFFECEYAVCAGLFSARKNHIALVKAAKQTGRSLLLIGQTVPNHKQYFKKVMAEINNDPRIKIISPQLPKNLAEIYCQAKVHALPSWLETPGLVSLEAFACGCNIVVSHRGSTPEYFGDKAFYCEPDNIQSIVNALDAAFGEPRGSRYNPDILKRFNWEQAALCTFEGYKLALEGK